MTADGTPRTVRVPGTDLHCGDRVWITGRWQVLVQLRAAGAEHFRATTDRGGSILASADSLYDVDVDAAHTEALEEDAAHDAAVAAAVPEDTYRAAEMLAERLVQGAPMYANRDLTTNPLTPAELQQVELATNLAGQQLQAQHRQLPRAVRYSRLTLVPPR